MTEVGWPTQPLSEVLDLFDSKRVPLSRAERSKRSGPYPYYGAQGVIDHIDDYIFDGRFILIPEDGENLRSRKLPVAYFAEGKFWVNNHAHIVRAKKSVGVDRFVQSAVQAADISPYITGAAQPKLSQMNLLRIEIPLPGMEEQNRVSAVLDALDDLIVNNRRRVEVLEEMARVIYREWFVHFRFPGHEDATFVDSDLGPIPEGWIATTVEALCSRIQAGGTPKRSESAFWEDGTIDWYKTGDLTDSVLTGSSELIGSYAVTDGRARLFQPETILMAIYGSPTVGRLGLVVQESSANQAALGMVAKAPAVTTEYLWFVLEHLRTYLNNLAQGAAQQNVSKQKVAASPAMLPPADVVEQFTNAVAPSWRSSHQLQDSTRVLSALRDRLLPKLVTGQIDVSDLDLDAVVEEVGV